MTKAPPAATKPREPSRRLSRDDRRRQLLGIGLRKLVERPIQDLSIDEVAAEAGISRGLLFHYFPTKNAFHQAVVEAAGRRVMRNVTPEDEGNRDERLGQFVQRFVLQLDRRRDSYLALVHGRTGASVGTEGLAWTLREAMARLVLDVTGLGEGALPVVHGWVAYVEDRALAWSEEPPAQRGTSLEALVDHCTGALHALLGVARVVRGGQRRDGSGSGSGSAAQRAVVDG
ncbi:MAG TPA: TetR/AcrR family transcriptional regulator [Dermatophilaceae bacterium]|nr:TetR/AcrR family transcriptional regulator [Dermatophilaceae bacterium]